MNKSTNLFKRILKGTWGTIDATRKVAINLLFLVIAIALLVMAFSNNDPKIAETTALVIEPQGQLVEQLTGKSFDQMLDEARGVNIPETLLKDVIDAIDKAKDDDRIQALVLNLSSFTGARLTKLQDLGEAITNFNLLVAHVVSL